MDIDMNKRNFIKYIGIAGITGVIALANAKQALAETVIADDTINSVTADSVIAPVVRCVTFVIAASNSTATGKNQADFVCTGINDEVVINNAINSLPVTGGTIQLLEGDYNLSNPLMIENLKNICLMGTQGSVLNDGVFMLRPYQIKYSQNVRISGIHFTIKHRNIDTPGYGIFLYKNSNVIIEDCWIDGGGWTPGYFNKNTNSWVAGVSTGNPCPRWGVCSHTNMNLILQNNYVTGTEYEGLSFWYSTLYSVMSGNVVEGCGFGLVVERESDYNTLTGNTVSFSTQGTSDVLIRNGHHNIVIGNTLFFPTAFISGNGININGVNIQSYSSNNVVVGNTIFNYYRGISIESGAYGNSIRDNNIFGSYNGIIVYGAMNAINGNAVQNCQTNGIVLGSPSMSNTISANKIICNQGAGGGAGIYISSSVNNKINDNEILFSGTYGIRSLGTSTGNIIEDNLIADDCNLIKATLGANGSIGNTNFTVSADPCNLAVGQNITIDGYNYTITKFINNSPTGVTDKEYPRGFYLTPVLASNVSTGIAITGRNVMVVGIRLAEGSVTGDIVTGNIIRNASSNNILYDSTKGAVAFARNTGFVTENNGTATITAGQTSVVISHFMALTPTRIMLNPTIDTKGKRYWVSAKTASNFTISIDSSGASDITFDWSAVV